MTLKELSEIKDSVKILTPEEMQNKVDILTKNNFVIRRINKINPLKIEESISQGSYFSLEKALRENNPKGIIDTIKKSGLRGRGGGGFPTGLKWERTAETIGEDKIVVCNADEGDPGAFMDRAILEGDPHSVLEAMAIAGFCIKATRGIVYVRAEYPYAVSTLREAIKQAEKIGVLGKNIFGSGFDFSIELRLGAGAFVCGEETSLIASVEGKRGEPKPRPPYPSTKGVYGLPTLINNVETYANIPLILTDGWESFVKVGTEKSKGTKVFAISGDAVKSGLAEVPMGTTINEMVYNIGGGIANGKKFKAAQTGGPSGGCIPASLGNTPLDYESLVAIGSIMGSGGLIIMDESTCMVDMAKFFLEFTVDESCGKCTPCRIGNKRLLEILTRITEGQGKLSDIDDLKNLSYYIKENSLCGLGGSSPNPVLSMLRHFESEYIEHIVEKKCKAGKCKKLAKFRIMPEKCIGCSACEKVCPVNAITGKIKSTYIIDESKCIRCGKCKQTCRFGAIENN